MTELLLKALLAYLLGNIMGGHIVGRLRGIDLGQVGSGNVGATNALRTQGKGFAVLVLLIDVGKGIAGALLVPLLPLGSASVSPEHLAYVCGAAVTLGHCYPALWGFKGGKGCSPLRWRACTSPALMHKVRCPAPAPLPLSWPRSSYSNTARILRA